MTEKAQALEALRQEIDWMLGGVGGTDSLTISAAILFRWKRTLAEAVQPTPPVGSQTTEQIREFKVYICDDCLHLRGEMCHEPGCRFCRRTMAEVAEYLDVLLIRPIINGVGVIVDRGEQL